ncbi:MAG: hypothetical protein WEB30_01780 [Cyclobacteriaceae bacterium]
MKLHRPLFYFLIATFALAFASCSKSGEDKDQNSREFDEAEEGTISDEIEGLTNNIPPPTEIPYMLQATGAEFNQSLVNSREKVDQYTTQNDKAAMNLGVYAADIGYLTSYDKTQEAIDYLTACKTLSEGLGLIGTFDAELLEEFEKNISNKDSLTRMLDRTMKESEQFLREGNRKQLSALVVAGGFIEGLYIATGLIRTYPKDILPEDSRNVVLTPLMKVILDQKKSVSEMVKILDAAEESEMVKDIRADFRKLEETYQDLNIEEQIRNNRADLVLSDKNLEGIAAIVEKIRTRITG